MGCLGTLPSAAASVGVRRFLPEMLVENDRWSLMSVVYIPLLKHKRGHMTALG
jgi:hypothetical protein